MIKFLQYFAFVMIPLLFVQADLFAQSKASAKNPIDSSIRSMEQRIQSKQNDSFGYAALGKLYYQKARRTGDVVYYQKAESALQTAIRIRPDYLSALIDLASACAAMHRFQNALLYATQVAQKEPDHPEVLAIQADAYLEIGNYPKAMEMSRRLHAAFPSEPAVLARQAHLEELMGRPKKALEMIQEAVTIAKKSGLRGQNLAWYYARLGDLYFHTGDLGQAKDSFHQALKIFNNFYIALSGLADVYEAEGKVKEAIHLRQKVVALNNSPGAFMALGELLSKQGASKKAQDNYDRAENLLTGSPLHRAIYSRELVYLYADQEKNLTHALEIAQNDLTSRKDIGGYDALAWALYKNKRFGEAEAAMVEALKLQTKEPDFYVHAAPIFEASGKHEESKRYASQALNLWPYLVSDDVKKMN